MEKEQELELKLLRAKDAIFRMIAQYCRCFRGEDSDYYMSDYYESALERSFSVLEIDKDEIPLMEYCRLWEDNNRKLCAANNPDREYHGCTAQEYYNLFVDEYKKFVRWCEEVADE